MKKKKQIIIFISTRVWIDSGVLRHAVFRGIVQDGRERGRSVPGSDENDQRTFQIYGNEYYPILIDAVIFHVARFIKNILIRAFVCVSRCCTGSVRIERRNAQGEVFAAVRKSVCRVRAEVQLLLNNNNNNKKPR